MLLRRSSYTPKIHERLIIHLIMSPNYCIKKRQLHDSKTTYTAKSDKKGCSLAEHSVTCLKQHFCSSLSIEGRDTLWRRNKWFENYTRYLPAQLRWSHWPKLPLYYQIHRMICWTQNHQLAATRLLAYSEIRYKEDEIIRHINCRETLPSNARPSSALDSTTQSRISRIP